MEVTKVTQKELLLACFRVGQFHSIARLLDCSIARLLDFVAAAKVRITDFGALRTERQLPAHLTEVVIDEAPIRGQQLQQWWQMEQVPPESWYIDGAKSALEASKRRQCAHIALANWQG